MSCKKYKDTCPDKTNAACVTYEGNVLENGDLDSCDCHTVEDVLEDIVEVLDDVYDQVFIENFDIGCLEVEKNSDGRYPISEVVQELVNLFCAEEEGTNSSSSGNCGQADPCYDGVYTNGLTAFLIDTPSATVSPAVTAWTEFTGVSFTAVHSGTYKITIEQDAVPTLSGDSFKLGIGVSNTEPINNPFSQKVLNPETSSKTTVFVIQSVKKGDILRPKYLSNVGTVTVSNTKVIYEKVS